MENESRQTMTEATTVTTTPVEPTKTSNYPALRIALFLIATLILLLAVFQLGMMVGFRKAAFTLHWNEHYQQNLVGPAPRMFEPPNSDAYINAHGVSGKVLRNEGMQLILQDRDALEKSVRMNDRTLIRRLRDGVSSSRIMIDDHVIILGEPNSNGEINAKFIRILPSPSR
jgi:hypothetical protein